ncbi:MAG: glycosyltransferase family 39 protein [Cyanobacteria bacterium J06635_1]
MTPQKLFRSQNREQPDQFSKKEFWIALVGFTIACLPILFWQLDQPGLRMWDEARQAVSALEMSFNHRWLILYFDGQPDMWSSKPPLLIWCMVFSMKLFGFNEFAVRLPSAISALGTATVLVLFGSLYFRRLSAGLISGFVLITTSGFVGEHVARTGDYDAMLLFWVTLYSICLFMYANAELEGRKSKYLLLATIFVTLAALTKSIAGVLMIPGFLMYLAHQKQLIKSLTKPQTYLAIIGFVAIISSYYVIRELQEPGFLQVVMTYEFGRYGSTLENHNHPITFYFTQIQKKFTPWFYLLPFCFFLTQLSHSFKVKQFGKFALWLCSSYLLIISLSKTKLPWYDAQFYPLASIVIGLGCSEILALVQNIVSEYRTGLLRPKKTIVKYVLIASLVTLPYANTFYATIYQNKGLLYTSVNNPRLMYGDYLKHITRSQPFLERFTVFYNPIIVYSQPYNAHLLFYSKVLNLDKYSINLKTDREQLIANEVVLTCDPESSDVIRTGYKAGSIDSVNNCQTYRIQR